MMWIQVIAINKPYVVSAQLFLLYAITIWKDFPPEKKNTSKPLVWGVVKEFLQRAQGFALS